MLSLLPLVRKHCWPTSILFIQAYLYTVYIERELLLDFKSALMLRMVKGKKGMLLMVKGNRFAILFSHYN